MRGMSLIGMAEQEVGTINYNVTSSSSHFFLQYLMTFMFCTRSWAKPNHCSFGDENVDTMERIIGNPTLLHREKKL